MNTHCSYIYEWMSEWMKDRQIVYVCVFVCIFIYVATIDAHTQLIANISTIYLWVWIFVVQHFHWWWVRLSLTFKWDFTESVRITPSLSIWLICFSYCCLSQLHFRALMMLWNDLSFLFLRFICKQRSFLLLRSRNLQRREKIRNYRHFNDSLFIYLFFFSSCHIQVISLHIYFFLFCVPVFEFSRKLIRIVYTVRVWGMIHRANQILDCVDGNNSISSSNDEETNNNNNDNNIILVICRLSFRPTVLVLMLLLVQQSTHITYLERFKCS